MTPPRDKIRVLRLIARLNIGGPAIHATLLTERLDPARYESLLVAGVESAAEGNYLRLHGRQLAGLRVVRALGREISPARDVATVLEVYRLIRRFRPHVVHTHTAKAGAVGRLAAWVARVPVVVHTYHGHVLQGYFSPAHTQVFLAIERALAHVTDRIVTVSEEIRRQILDFGVGTPGQVTVLRLGLDLEPFVHGAVAQGQFREELGIGDAPLVGIVARLVPIKRHEDFLAAAARVAQRLPSCRFVVVGDGERRAELETLASSAGIRERVHFLGWRRDLARIYADLDVAVLCSANEGSPVSLIEAMAAGRAVVATRVGGVPDIIEDGLTGLLTPASDPAALADAITVAITDVDRRRQMGEAGRKRVYPAYTADRLVRDVEHLYEQLLSRTA